MSVATEQIRFPAIIRSGHQNSVARYETIVLRDNDEHISCSELSLKITPNKTYIANHMNIITGKGIVIGGWRETRHITHIPRHDIQVKSPTTSAAAHGIIILTGEESSTLISQINFRFSDINTS